MNKLDKMDQKILQLLDWHGRMPLNQIAKKIGSNKDVVAYRIKKMEQADIITRYFPVLDMSKLGYHTSRIYFDLEEMNQSEENSFVQFLDEKINAGVIFRMDYPYRHGIIIWTKSIYEIEPLLLQIKRHLGKHLLRYNYTLFCTYKMYPKDYLFGKKHHDTSYLNKPNEKQEYNQDYEQEEYDILKLLADDARISTVELSRILNIPQTTISHKLKKLEQEKIILGYRAQINYAKLGYTNYFLEIYLEENTELKQIESWTNTHPHTVWLQKVIGTCDIEIEVEVNGRQQLEQLLQELRRRFPSIRKIIFFSQEYKKMTFLPG
ncbi:hypothetical protein A2642_00220 [Candidatus Nomurabacteria bacterium RIFCSPHIGHO2_01_FULL_39_10]|uniref:HTH asnC-type domain-containing protein n=1 Tax=Candidatus Nomurabacteria bacterium RIFCSPHIGHO2_01_FULL_39_10 TaxID=1801733 RepID=A0A1F6V2F2_9BACT|nr:MAG: hypothetical protein A2642_00220 [Candidatus Nomurabacteria bacterium RIFCSPHIGHO2_01_FULL_39_10]